MSSAHAPAQHPLAGLETKSARPGGADPVADLIAKIDGQGREIKAIGDRVKAGEVKTRVESVIASTQRMLSELRDTADRRAAAAKSGRADPLDDEKLRRVNGAIDDAERKELAELRAKNRDLQRKLARPGLPAGSGPVASGKAAVMMAQKAALHYLRTGETSFEGKNLRDIERAAFGIEGKAMHGGSNADGGFLVLPERDMTIEKLLAEYVPMRQVADVKTLTNARSYEKPVRTSTGGARWGSEIDSGGETGTPKYALLDFPAHDLYAEPRVSSDLVEDSSYDIVGEINDGALEDFSLSEAVAFISGDGVGKPFGILGYEAAAYVANASWAWGKIGYRATGASGAFPTSAGSVGSADPILMAATDMKQAYRQQAKWMMNRSTMGVSRTLKDANGAYVWIQGDLTRGIPNTLDGREVIEAEQMPDIAANSFAIALADWKRAYIVIDRLGMTVLRDPYSAYPRIAFKTRKRVGGGIKNFEAIKLLKFAAS